MSAVENKAVFLSYASQDAEAVERIAEALRAAGVEVWFDKNELTGGDAWDQKIRGQIKACALFVPVISAATNARREGYFRREWKIAVDRTHDMDEALPFLLPVVIDATTDAGAFVPEKFREVQWTRLPGGETPPKFCERVKKLLGGSELEAGRPHPAQRDEGVVSPAKRATSRSWLVPVIAAGALLVAVAAYFSLRARRSPEEIAQLPAGAPTIAAEPAAKPAAALPVLTEAQKLVEQARQVLETSDELNRENLYLVEDLAKRALALEPANPDAWLISARVSYSLVWLLIDNSTQRRELVLQQAKRAVTLAPGSGAARLALINAQSEISYAYSGTLVGSDLEREARALVDAEPQNWRTHRALGTLLRALNRWDEAVVEHRKAYELSHDHPGSAADLINVLVRRRLFAEADEVRARAMSHDPAGRLLCWDAMLKLRWHGDAAAAREALKTWPSWLSQEDRGLFQTWQTWMWSRQPESALRTARVAVRDLARDFSFYGPVAVLRAQANELAGNVEAARADWQTALDRAERELAAEPDNEPGLYWKAWALARLGRVAEAKPLVSILAQRNQREVSAFFKATYLEPLQLLVGEKQLALTGLRRRLTASDDTIGLTRAMLELDPNYDAVRADPEFQAIVRDAPAPRAPASTRPDAKSIAVLPFVNMGADKADEYLGDGMTEELLNALAKVKGLRVPGRSSSFAFKGRTDEDIFRQVGEKLHVSTVLEGSVRKVGDKIRITAQLINCADGNHLWSEEYDRNMTDLLAVQSEVAQQVTQKLQVALGVEESRSLAKASTKNPEAHRLYLLGRFHFSKQTEAGFAEAAKYYRQALALDPNYALPYCGLADNYGFLGGVSMPGKEAWPREKELAEKALALDPNLAEAHFSLGLAFADLFDWPAAEREMQRALELNPNYALAHDQYAWVLLTHGRFDEALAEERKALELDPLSPLFNRLYAVWLRYARRWDEAYAQARHAQELDPNALHDVMGRVLYFKGDLAGALVEFQKQTDRSSRDYASLAFIYARTGERPKAEQILRDLDGMAKQRYVSPADRAYVYVALGEKERALDWLERSYDEQDPECAMLKVEPMVDPLRGEPRFQALLKKVGLDQ